MWGDCLSELWWGRSEGYSLAWVKVNVGWEVLNIEDYPFPCWNSASVLCHDFLGCGKDCPLAAKEGMLTDWCALSSSRGESTVATCVTPAEFKVPEKTIWYKCSFKESSSSIAVQILHINPSLYSQNYNAFLYSNQFTISHGGRSY